MNRSALPAVSWFSFVAALLLCSVGLSASAEAPVPKLEPGIVPVLGISATVDGLNSAVPRNAASRLRILMSAGGTALSTVEVTRLLGAGFELRADLSGPGRAGTRTLSTPADLPPSDAVWLAIPALTESGNYELSNIRIVVKGQPVLEVLPQRVVLRVTDGIPLGVTPFLGLLAGAGILWTLVRASTQIREARSRDQASAGLPRLRRHPFRAPDPLTRSAGLRHPVHRRQGSRAV